MDRCWGVVPADGVSTVFIRSLMVLPLAAGMFRRSLTGAGVRLFAGDDRAGDHHDVEVMNEAGKVLGRGRLPEGAAGMAQFHGLIGQFLPEDDPDAAQVVIGIETGRGPWVA